MDTFARHIFRGFSITDPGNMSINRTKFHWLIRLRTIATITQVLAFIPGVRLGLISPSGILPYYLVVISLTGFNVCSLWWIQRRQFEPSDGAVFIQLTVDLATLTCLLNVSGGWHNPFVSLYFLHAGLGALLLRWRLNVLFFALVVCGIAMTFCLTGFSDLDAPPSLLPGITLLLAHMCIALMIWILTSWLANTMRTLNHNVQVLREQNSRLNRLRAVGAIAAGFSHSLATPLNTLKMRIERVARRSNGQVTSNDIQVALHSIARCEDILRTYFAGRLEPDQLALEAIDIVAFVQRVCKNWLLDHHEVDLQIEAPKSPPLSCQLSPVEFSRSLIDVLDNAREAHGHGKVHIAVTVRRVESEVEILIDDDGPGFSDDVLARVGEPFLTEKPDGFGLGLFTAFALTHSLSGHFAILNRDTGGGRVIMRLPVINAEYDYDDPKKALVDC